MTSRKPARRYPKPSLPPRRFVSPRAKEGHRVADFNSLDALLRHERDENGAKYAYRSPGSIRIYYPDGKGFKEGVAWKEQGYWHSQAPSERVSVSKPPQGSEAIVGKSLMEARRGAGRRPARTGSGPVSPADRRTARGAEARGEQYANDQLESDYFMEWVRSQLAEAAQMPPEDVLPLETKKDAMVIAKNMLQQLEWDAKRDLQEDKAFWEGFGEVLYASREWLADELLSTKNGDQIFKKARVEAPRSEGRWRGYNGYNTISPGIEVWVSGDQPTSVRISGPATQHADVERKVQSWWGAQGLHFRWLSHDKADIDLDPLAYKTRGVAREARRAPKAGTRAAEPGGMRDVLKGWSVGWNDEISASAAVRDVSSKNGRRRIVVMTQDDHEPRNPNASVELGLYELADDEWVQVHYADFDTPADAVKAVQTDPAWA